MKHLRINAVLLAALCCINVSCTTNRVHVDDHSYHHNDTPSGTTIINNHYPAPVPKPTLPQLDQEYLQYTQSSRESLSQYTPSVVYPPYMNGTLSYQVPQVFSHRYEVPGGGYVNASYAYRARCRAQLGY
jgi:hypothetical protein